MRIRQSAERIEIHAPAKVNLFFEVLSRREDGFHEIETLMAPIGLFDSLFLEDEPSGRVTMTVRWGAGLNRAGATKSASESGGANDSEQIPEGDNNIAVKAVRLLAERAAVNRGAKLELVKRIPMAAGLGGGSSDAAAALVAANLAWQLNWSNDQLKAVAAELGSDVPFFLAGGPAICRGRGEKMEPVAGIGVLHLVIVKPAEGLSTATVYGACQPGDRPVAPVIEALRKKQLGAVGPITHNRLLEPARRLSPRVQQVLDRLAAENPAALGMSGSGSSCFALCHSAREAGRTAARLRARLGATCRIWAVRSV